MSTSTTVSKLSQKLSWLAAGILFLVPFQALVTTWPGSNFGHLDLFRIWEELLQALMLPFLVWLVIVSSELRKSLFESTIVRLYGLYFLLHLVLGIWAIASHQVNGSALIYGLIINLRFIGFFIICTVLASKSGFLRRYWKIILLGPSTVVIIFGLLQKFLLDINFLRHFGYGPKTIPAYSTVDNNLSFRRVQSTLRGPNPLGAYLVVVVTYMLAAINHSGYKKLGLLMAGLVVMFYSYSRSALLATFIAVACLVLWRPHTKQQNRLIIIMSVLFVCTSLVVFVVRGNTRVQETVFHISSQSSSPTSSNSVRVEQLKLASKDIIHHPLGGGPGTAGPASVRNNHPSKIAENYYLQIAQEVGIIGLVIFIAINFLVARELWKNRQDQLSKVLLASLVGLTMINLLSHAWTDDTLAYLWWGLAGIALAKPIVAAKR